MARKPEYGSDVVIDVPSGRVTARVATGPDCRVRSVDFVNVPSYQLHDLVKVETPAGTVNTAISFGGAIYAHVDIADLGLNVTTRDLPRLIELSREMKNELNGTRYAEHPADSRLNGVYGVIFFEDLGDDDTGNGIGLPGHAEQRGVGQDHRA